MDSIIGSYVQKDPTAFYTYEEYQTALAAFKNIGNLRAESISGQLDGTVPSTTEEQRTAPDKLIDASSVKLSELGSGGFGGGFGDGERNFGDFGNRSDFPEPNGRNFPADFENIEAAPPDFTEIGSERGFPNGKGSMQNEPPDFAGTGDGEVPPQLPYAENGNSRPIPADGESTYSKNAKVPDFGMGNGRPVRPDSETAPESGGGNLAVTGICAGILLASIFGASLVKRKF